MSGGGDNGRTWVGDNGREVRVGDNSYIVSLGDNEGDKVRMVVAGNCQVVTATT